MADPDTPRGPRERLSRVARSTTSGAIFSGTIIASIVHVKVHGVALSPAPLLPILSIAYSGRTAVHAGLQRYATTKQLRPFLAAELILGCYLGRVASELPRLPPLARLALGLPLAAAILLEAGLVGMTLRENGWQLGSERIRKLMPDRRHTVEQAIESGKLSILARIFGWLNAVPRGGAVSPDPPLDRELINEA